MTPEHIELHRKRFEELSGLDENYLMRNMHGDYFYPETRHQFKGYLMHAENMEVALPEECDGVVRFKNDYVDDMACFPAIETKKMLESQGIKIKSSGS